MSKMRLDCKEEYDCRVIEISCREDRNLHRTEKIITEYMKTYRFLEPLYFVLKKFLHNTKLCRTDAKNGEVASTKSRKV